MGRVSVQAVRAVRKGRAVLPAVVAAAVVLGGCSDDGPGQEVVAAAPGVLADAAAEVVSGRFEVLEDGGPAFTGRFSGDDVEMEVDLSALVGREDAEGDGQLPEEADGLLAGPQVIRVVDGVSYSRLGDDERWERWGDELSGSMPADAGFAAVIGSLLDAADEVVVRSPGVVAERDGRSVTRYTGELAGAAAEEALRAGIPSGSFTLPDGLLDEAGRARVERIEAYRLSRTRIELVGEVGGDGRLARLEVADRTDTSGYPDCGLLLGGGEGTRFVLYDLGSPQQIEAPPADLVDDEQDLWDLGTDDDGSTGGPATTVAGGGPDEPLEEPLQTAAGPREPWQVLDTLRRWADAQGIDWTELPLPSVEEQVALYDRLVAEFGPAVDGMWVDAPSAPPTAADLEAELARGFEEMLEGCPE